jgi:hypothetical protein
MSYLSDSVGDAIDGERGGSWADGGVGSEHLSGVHGAVRPGSRGCGESSEGDDGELHLDGCCLVLFTLKVIKRWESLGSEIVDVG